jgi:SAM-dependent methyltransferase
MAFADFVRYQHPTAVLEIGGGHGKLSSIYREDIEWTIMEPPTKLVEGSSVRIIKEFFTEDTDLEQCKFDTIVHSHLFEHVHHPDQFVKLMADSLPVGGKAIFSVPNMKKMLEKKFTNCLNFEHTYFLSEEYITYLMSKHGFKILAQEYFMEDNSIFYAWEKTTDAFEMPLSANLYTIYKKLFLEYIEYHIDLVDKLNNDISQYDSYYLFGAHVFSQYLIKFGLNTSKLKCILDNDKLKQTKRMYGTDILVDSPKVLAEDILPVIIVRAGSFTDEIRLDILQNINQKTIFL